MHERHVIIAHNDVSQSTQSLLHALHLQYRRRMRNRNDRTEHDVSHLDGIGKRIANVHHFLVRGIVGQKQTLGIAGAHSSHQSRAGQRRSADGNVVFQLCLDQPILLRSTWTRREKEEKGKKKRKKERKKMGGKKEGKLRQKLDLFVASNISPSAMMT